MLSSNPFKTQVKENGKMKLYVFTPLKERTELYRVPVPPQRALPQMLMQPGHPESRLAPSLGYLAQIRH